MASLSFPGEGVVGPSLACGSLTAHTRAKQGTSHAPLATSRGLGNHHNATDKAADWLRQLRPALSLVELLFLWAEHEYLVSLVQLNWNGAFSSHALWYFIWLRDQHYVYISKYITCRIILYVNYTHEINCSYPKQWMVLKLWAHNIFLVISVKFCFSASQAIHAHAFVYMNICMLSKFKFK